jgi:hypothetical protein
MLEEFRTLVRAGVLRVTADNDLVFVKPPGGDWGREGLRPIPSTTSEEEIRKVDEQVLDWVRRKRQEPSPEPAEPQLTDVREQVVERLTEKILQQWESSTDRTLQDEVIERITSRILKRWSSH